MRFDLPALTLRVRNPRRKSITIRDIVPPATLATNLYTSTYALIVQLWQQAGQRLSTEYERTLSGLTTDSTADLQGILNEADDFFTRLLLRLEPLMRDWTLRTERWQRSKWVAAVKSASSVDLATMLGPEDVRQTLDDYIRWNVSLMKDVSAQARKRLSDIVFAGVSQRQSARDVAASIREVHGMTKRRAMGIASDQLSKVTSALAEERRRQAGIDVWEWVHSRKAHPRAKHRERDGNYYSESAARVGTSVDGKTVHAPPSADDLPGRPPYCGCRSRSVLIFD